MQVHQVLTLWFAVIQSVELQPVDRSLLSGGIQIFVRFYGHDDGPFAIEVPSIATVQDAIDQIVAVKSIPKYSTFTCQGQQLQTNDILSECGIVPESVIEIKAPKTDIENLFNLFDDPKDAINVFGYKNYSDFSASEPLHANKNHYFRSRWIVIQFSDKGRADFVQTIDISGEEEWHWPISSWNWDVLEQFEALEVLQIVRTTIGGVVPFSKLPRGLKRVNFCDNKFDQILHNSDVSALPPNLIVIHLDCHSRGRQFKGVVRRAAFPKTVESVSNGALLSMEQDD